MALRDLPDAVPARPGLAAPHSLSPDEPYIEAPVAVRALVRGELREAWVWGGEATGVYLRWKTDAENHLGWVPAVDVERS